MKRRPKTLRQHLARSLTTALVMFVMLCGGAALAEVVDPPSDAVRPALADQPPLPGTPADLVAKHDCWSGAAPADMAGKLPGHVVVTLPNERVRYGGTALVGKALDQLFGDVDHGLAVHAFCR